MQFIAVQFDIAWEDKRANHAVMESMLRDVDIEPGAFILLPELGDTGFSFNLEVHDDPRVSIDWAIGLARSTRAWVQVGYAERAADGRGRNCATLVSPTGDLLGTYRKVHPFSYGRESQYFGAGEELLVQTCGDARICPLICYDLRFPELWRLGARAGAEIFTIGASWPAARQSHWRTLAIARAIENQAVVVAVNRVGQDPHLHYAGGSIIVDPQGEILAEADDSPTVISASIDIEAIRSWRSTFPALADMHEDLLGEIPRHEPAQVIDNSSPSGN